MSEKERKIYELYKPEQIVPSERGVDLLNDARYNKVTLRCIKNF